MVMTASMTDDEMAALSAARGGETGEAPAPVATPAPPPSDTSDAYQAAREAADPNKSVTVRGQTFRLVDELPGLLLMDLGVAGSGAASQEDTLMALRDFLRFGIVEEDRARFRHLLMTAKDPVIGVEDLNAIVTQMVPKVTGRPT